MNSENDGKTVSEMILILMEQKGIRSLFDTKYCKNYMDTHVGCKGCNSEDACRFHAIALMMLTKTAKETKGMSHEFISMMAEASVNVIRSRADELAQEIKDRNKEGGDILESIEKDSG